MPYSGASDSKLPERIKKMSLAMRKKWVGAWNSAYNSCVSDGGDKSNCEGKAFRIANSIIKKDRTTMSWIDKLAEAIKRTFQDDPDLFKLIENELETEKQAKKIERAIGVDNLITKIYQAVREKFKDEKEEYYWNYSFQRLMVDGGSYYAVFNKSGELYRSYVTVNGGSVTLGDFEQVEEEYRPVQRSSVRVHRQKDGRPRITMIAATSVLNRDKEIDSSKLFDNFVQHSEELELKPLIDFYHLGQRSSEHFDIGEIDFQTRVGVAYITSGVVDESKPLGRAVVRALDQKETNDWGCSIEYFPVIGSVERMSMDDDTDVYIYNDGINTRVTILPEKDAASLFTGIFKERNIMGFELTARQKEALRNIFDDEDEFNSFLENVENVNEEVERNKLVHREKDKDGDKDKEENQEDDDKQESMSGVIELDDNLVNTIADMVTQRMQESQEDSDEDQDQEESVLREIQETLTGLSAQFSGLLEATAELKNRVKELETDEETKKEKYLQDLPKNTETERLFVTHKASSRSKNGKESDAEDTVSYGDIAAETLNSIPRSNKRN